MTAGAKDEPIAIERNTKEPNGAGGFTDSWGAIPGASAIWAKVVAKAGREGLESGRTNATFVNLFIIWRDDCPTVTDVDRIVWNGENWNIRGIRREGSRRLELVIEAERGVAT